MDPTAIGTIRKGWALFLHAFFMVYNNLGAAARISIPWVLVSGIGGGACVFVLDHMLTMQVPMVQFAGVAGVFVLLVVLAAISSIIAIQWHRFVLLGELPSGYLTGWRELPYRAYTIQVLKILFFLVVLSYFSRILIALLFPAESVILSALALSLIVTFVFLRLAIGLPAIALSNDSIGPAKSWEMSKDFREVLFVTSILLTLLNTIPEILGLFTAGVFLLFVLTLIIFVVLVWFSMMVGISLLTTLYGVYVENRPL